MKNLKLILAAAVVILALSACQNLSIGGQQPIGRQPVQVPTSPAQPPVTNVPPATSLAQLCAGGNGNWLAEFGECENVSKDWCEAKGGTFNECASACRHNPKAEVCTMNCVPVCSLKESAANPPVIGGQRDEHGCLVPAGYAFDSGVGACIRAFEMTADIKRAAKIAVAKAGAGYALTVVSFNSYEEAGSYDITLERGLDRTQEKVSIKNWQVVSGGAPASATDTQGAIQGLLAKKYNKPLAEVRVTVDKEVKGFASGSVLFGQGGPGEGGMWLAVSGNGWSVVWDGNGNVDCEKMRQEYGFPSAILEPNFCGSSVSKVESAVRAFVASKAGVAEGKVAVVSTEKKDWTDSCLGLGGPAESCLAATTPGYLVTVKVNGVEQKARANSDGSEIRMENN